MLQWQKNMENKKKHLGCNLCLNFFLRSVNYGNVNNLLLSVPEGFIEDAKRGKRITLKHYECMAFKEWKYTLEVSIEDTRFLSMLWPNIKSKEHMT